MTISVRSIYKQLLNNGLEWTQSKNSYEVNLIDHSDYIKKKNSPTKKKIDAKPKFTLCKQIFTLLKLAGEAQMSVNWSDYFEKYVREYTNKSNVSVEKCKIMRYAAYYDKKH